MLNFDFYNPTQLLFGAGKLNELSACSLPGKKALVLISNGKSTKEHGYLERTLEQLRLAKIETVVFDQIMENPTKEVVNEGARFARTHQCDFIVALGGGAVIDASCAIAAMTSNEGELWDYVCGGTGKGQPLTQKGLPIVAIATTSGTGSEMNGFGVISNLETKEKIGFGESSLVPVIAIVDPELMLTVPKKYTAYQGFDALFHHTEVMMSKGINILSEAIALSSIASITKYLPLAVEDGKNLEARSHVAYGSTMAGITMQLTSTTAQHSIEHSMSAYHPSLPHGAGLIMISKAFAEFFIEKHACDEQFIKIAKAMGNEFANKPEDFLVELLKLQKACGVDNLKMSDYGFEIDEAMTLAKGARSMQGGLFEANPCELSDEDCAQILMKAYR